MRPELWFYSPQFSPRLEYVLDFVFNSVLKYKLHRTKSIPEINHKKKSEKVFLINYSTECINGAFQIKPHDFLFKTNGFNYRLIKSESYYGTLVGDTFTESSDLFTSVFYFISRAEEWQQRKRDAHNRFYDQSIDATEFDFSEPYVDIWIDEFRLKLNEFFLDLNLQQPEFKTVYTFDIDNAFAFKGRSLCTTVFGLMKDVLFLKGGMLKQRCRVVLGISNDPFDVYKNLLSYIIQKKLDSRFFFLINRKTSWDKGARIHSKAFKNLITLFKPHAQVCGVHPSYISSENTELIEQESKTFSDLFGVNTIQSRQHFLKFNIQSTPIILNKAGISSDWSMGFSDRIGFRARTTHAFKYYNFNTETPEQLQFIPFCMMDGVFYIHGKIPLDEALTQVSKIKERIRKLGGQCVFVFHERTFSELHHPGYSRFFYKISEI